ncbi:MAG: sugar-binding protein, partial [Planctomycetota bacterium]
MFFSGNFHFAQPEFGDFGPTCTPNDWRTAGDRLSQGWGTPDAIDGDLSDWNLEAITPAALDAVEQLSSGQDIWTGPEDCSAEFYMLWDDVNIYMAVVVKDEKLVMNKTEGSIWNSDCVEMFFATTEAIADHPWSNPTIHYQYGFNADNQTWNWCNMDGPGQSVPDYLQAASSVTADGYICEVSIEYAQMTALDFSAGNTISIHPCIDDTDIDGGDTEYQMSWTGLAAHDQSMGFGHMILSADSAPELEPAPTIAWVSYHAADDEPHADAAAVGFTQAPDIEYTDLLKANGYDVVRVLTSQTPDVEYLNTMDLVIISRTASSGHYSGGGATLWNSVTAPMINLNGYTLRSSRLGFTDGTDMPDTTGDIRLAVTDPTHPIFAGIALTDGVMDNLYAEGAVPLPTDGVTLSRGISINNNNIDDEGMVLATVAEVSADTGPVGGMVIAEFPVGATMENSSGSPDDVLGGPRLVFLTGSREPDGVTGGQAAALYDLYPDGEQMFLNAVKYMIPVVPVNPGSDGLIAYYALENDVNDSSGNGLDGVIVGDPVFVEGAVGMGLQLDGVDDYVDLGNDPLFDLTGSEVTLAAWVNVNDIGNGENDPWVGKGDTSYMIKGH